jgi:hypothetical protein
MTTGRVNPCRLLGRMSSLFRSVERPAQLREMESRDWGGNRRWQKQQRWFSKPSTWNHARQIVRQFFREHPSANIIRVALPTRDLKPLRARIWRIIDGNLEAATDIVVGFIMTQPRGAVTISARDT